MRVLALFGILLLLGGCHSHSDACLPMVDSVCRTRGEPAAFASEHRLQFILTEVIRGRRVDHVYRADAEYFYPASTVKLHASVAALERLNELRRTSAPKADERTPLPTGSLVRVGPKKGGQWKVVD